MTPAAAAVATTSGLSSSATAGWNVGFPGGGGGVYQYGSTVGNGGNGAAGCVYVIS